VVFQKLLGPRGKMPILIRDDDTNFFTKTNMLDSIYEDAWERGFKVSLSIVPFQRSVDDICVPPEVRTIDSNFSIAANKQLVHYLKDKIHNGNIEVLQHGFSHENNKDGRGEFGEDIDKKNEILLGRDILKQSFEVDPKFFVPPGEDISKLNLRTLVNVGLIPIYRQTFLDSFLRSGIVPTYLKQIAMRQFVAKYKKRAVEGNSAIQFPKPVVISIEHKMVSWSLTSLTQASLSSFDSLLKFTNKLIKSCMISRSPVCIINHYHTYYYDWNPSITRKDLFKDWIQLLTIFNNLKFGWKVTFSELYERTNLIRNIRTAKTGSKITIESETRIRDFSFRTSHHLEPTTSFLFDQDTNIVTIEDLLPNQKIALYEK
jgi:hypothetical protein